MDTPPYSTGDDPRSSRSRVRVAWYSFEDVRPDCVLQIHRYEFRRSLVELGTYPYDACSSAAAAAPPAVVIRLVGVSEPGCSFTTNLNVLFDRHNRVQRFARFTWRR